MYEQVAGSQDDTFASFFSNLLGLGFDYLYSNTFEVTLCLCMLAAFEKRVSGLNRVLQDWYSSPTNLALCFTRENLFGPETFPKTSLLTVDWTELIFCFKRSKLEPGWDAGSIWILLMFSSNTSLESISKVKKDEFFYPSYWALVLLCPWPSLPSKEFILPICRPSCLFSTAVFR